LDFSVLFGTFRGFLAKHNLDFSVFFRDLSGLFANRTENLVGRTLRSPNVSGFGPRPTGYPGGQAQGPGRWRAGSVAGAARATARGGLPAGQVAGRSPGAGEPAAERGPGRHAPPEVRELLARQGLGPHAPVLRPQPRPLRRVQGDGQHASGTRPNALLRPHEALGRLRSAPLARRGAAARCTTATPTRPGGRSGRAGCATPRVS